MSKTQKQLTKNWYNLYRFWDNKISFKHLINVAIMVALFTAGIQLGMHLERQSQETVNQKAIIRVQDIKELMTVVK